MELQEAIDNIKTARKIRTEYYDCDKCEEIYDESFSVVLAAAEAQLRHEEVKAAYSELVKSMRSMTPEEEEIYRKTVYSRGTVIKMATPELIEKAEKWDAIEWLQGKGAEVLLWDIDDILAEYRKAEKDEK
jgi:hypothetical protein